MRQVGIYTDRESYWKNSDQRQRWVGMALQEIEPKLRTVGGYRHLRELREAMKDLNFKENIIKVESGIVQTESLPTIEADPIQMRQLLQNLISKAIKFKKKEKAPNVELAAKQCEKDFWDIFVKDNGIGFDSQHGDSIFQPFFRLHGRNQYEGSGIGLAISKKFVDRHHGKIKTISS
jgi:light-regulated signal transduction histidine kinase (bacteriophytochrome)